jgi:hypothetical protein
MEKFKTGKVAVNCRTKEAAKKFLKECGDAGLKWLDGTPAQFSYNFWGLYKEKTHYRNSVRNFTNRTGMQYGTEKASIEEGVEIIEYKEETMTTQEMMAALLENPDLIAGSESLKGTVKEIRYNTEIGTFENAFSGRVEAVDMRITDWQIIKPEPKEIEFKEAAKALSEGIVVYSIYGGVKTIYRNRAKFLDTNNSLVTLTEINKAKWYIEVQP